MTRRYDIDWLRIGATYLLFVFHGAMVFNPAPFYHIRNVDVAFPILVLCGFISLWHMPLFFLLAGWSAHASFRARGASGFGRERLRKLGVPLVAGCVLFGPVIKYLELQSGLDLSHTGLRVSPALQESFREIVPTGLSVLPPFTESFREFWPTYFTSAARFSWSHLWFVAYLLTFSLLYRPLFAWLLRRPVGAEGVNAAWVYAPIVPLVLIQVVLRPYWPGIQNLYNDWANVAYYSVYLIGGFILAATPALEAIVERERKRALALGVATALVLLMVIAGVVPSPTIALAGSAVAGWAFVVAILGFGRSLLSFTNETLVYLRHSAFPVYILHQIALVVVGYFLILDLPLGVAPKLVLLITGAVLTTLAIYHWLVRRSAMTAFLFGVQPVWRYTLQPVARPATVAWLVLMTIGVPSRALASTPLGRWHAEGGAAEVEIHRCGRRLCGTVVELRSPFDETGCALRDRYNPDPALRDRPVLGMEILRDLAPEAGGAQWSGGTIYDPGSGRSYSCQLGLDEDDRLQLRGYLGVPLIGRTTTWLRVGAERICRP